MSTFGKASGDPATLIGACVDVLDTLPEGTPDVELVQAELIRAESLVGEYGSQAGTRSGEILALRGRAQAALAVHQVLLLVAWVLYKRFQHEGHYEYGHTALAAIASAQASICLAARSSDFEAPVPAATSIEVEPQRVADESMIEIEREARNTKGVLDVVAVSATDIFSALLTTSMQDPPEGTRENALKILATAQQVTEAGERALKAAEQLFGAVDLCAAAFDRFVGSDELGYPDTALMLRQLL